MTTNMTIGMAVYETMDYDLFTFLEGNRNLNKANLRKLIASMEEEHLLIPIIVNEKFQIIDGQHRFTACKVLEKPIHYIINQGYGLEQVKRANTVGVNWTNEDFLQTYIEDGDPNYISIHELKKESGLQLNIILKILSTFQGQSNLVTLDKFKNGVLKVNSNGEWSGIRFFCKQLEMFSEYKDYKASSFVNAFLKLYMHEDYNPIVMEKQSKWIANFQPKGKSSEVILEELCKSVYSYRLPQGKIFYYKEHGRFYK